MKNFLSISLLALPFAALGSAQQVTITPTTLSTAITSTSVKTITLTSTTNALAGNIVYVDNESMVIEQATPQLIVQRGAGGTAASTHASGALAFVGAPNLFGSRPAPDPGGSCTRSTLAVVPLINITQGIISDCLGGQWVRGVRTPNAPYRVTSPEPAATAYTGINTNGTTLGATTLYCSELNLKSNKLLTGIALLNGTTVGTDHHYVVLYDATGNALANSALAGALTSGASTYQSFAFTSTFYAVGPSQYFACFQSNGATDTVRMALTGINDNLLTKGQTGATFGTIPALTAPTGFNTAVGPYVFVY